MKIGIFGSEYQSGKQFRIHRIFEQLSELGIEVWVEKSFYDYLYRQFEYKPEVSGLIVSDMFQLDVALSLGGDGTFLRTAAHIGKKEIPILGINMGRLGFLADINVEEIENTIRELVEGDYRIESRALLQIETDDNTFPDQYNYALNEIAVLKRDTSSMIAIHAFVNNKFLNTYLSDGLLIATPTGSTAYSMSVDGPIIVPQAKNFVLSPVAPHSLNVRPLVIPDDCSIQLEVETRSNNFLVALDGRSAIFPSGTKFNVRKADFSTKVIKRSNHTFYQTLREKLMWGSDARGLEKLE